MPRRPGQFEDPVIAARARSTRRSRRRMKELRESREQIMAQLTPQTEADKIGLYQSEKARAMERWARNGGPVCGLSSGRCPLTGPVTRQSA